MTTDVVPSTKKHVTLILLSAAVLLGTMWIASQGGLRAISAGKFAASIYLILSSVPYLAAFWLGAAGFGFLLRLWLLPYVRAGLVLQFGLGMACFLLLNWLLAWFGWMNAYSAWGLCGVGFVLLIWQVARSPWMREKLPGDRPPPIELPWTLPLMMPGLALLLVAATCPPGTLWRVEAYGYDVMTYHLQIPREWLAAGGMTGLQHNVYSYLPSLVEAAYSTLGVMHGSMLDAVYTCQLFHVSLAVLAATGVAAVVAAFVSRSAAIVAAGVMLALPWVVITGSLAYNEMAVLAFAAVACVILFDVVSERWRGAAAIGFLLGAATLAKPTAGPLFAIPIGIVLLARLNHAIRWRRPREWPVGMRTAGIAAIAGLLTLSPYFVRNWTWTGNPVFPFATQTLGTGHWDQTLATRWNEAHGLSLDQTDRASALGRQWLFNTGYGAVGGTPTPRETQNIARFDQESGIPLLWAVVLMAALFTISRLGMRRAVAAMGAIIAMQVLFWMLVTHLQSRFLIPTVVPAAVLVGIGVGRLSEMTQKRFRLLYPVAIGSLVACLALTSMATMFRQTQMSTTLEGERVATSPTALIDALESPPGKTSPMLDHPINRLPRSSKTYLVADYSSVFYLQRPIVYHSAFDTSPLGQIIREADGDPAKVNEALKADGITHVWVHWSELNRLHSTYGYDSDVTPETLERLIATGWRPVGRASKAAALFALP